MSDSKRETLNNVVLLLILAAALHIAKILPSYQNTWYYLPLSLTTAIGAHALLIRIINFAVAHSEILLRLYWGKIYLNGFWSYEYTLNGKNYFGIWRFEQDLDRTRVIGSGLNERFLQRTIVRSVSPLIEDQGAYFILNERTELDTTSGLLTPVYSKTTLILDNKKGFGAVTTMRATTEIYGGTSSGQLHPDVVFRKQMNASSDEDVIGELKKKYKLGTT